MLQVDDLSYIICYILSQKKLNISSIGKLLEIASDILYYYVKHFLYHEKF